MRFSLGHQIGLTCCLILSVPFVCVGYKKRSFTIRQTFGFLTYPVQSTSIPYKTTGHGTNQMDCVVECVNNASCVAVDHFNTTCSFYDGRPALAEDLTLEHAVVFVRDVIAMNVVKKPEEQYQYTLIGAASTCESLGGRLANQSELQTLYYEGYELCICGWILEGDSLFPMQISRPECGDSVGLVSCNWMWLYAAWCSFV